jgi:hypothetical protein
LGGSASREGGLCEELVTNGTTLAAALTQRGLFTTRCAMPTPLPSPSPASCWAERIAPLPWPPADAPPRLVYETPDALGLRLGRLPDPAINEALLRCLLEEACGAAAPLPGLCLHWCDAQQGFVGVVGCAGRGSEAPGASAGLRALARYWLQLTAQAAALAACPGEERP